MAAEKLDLFDPLVFCRYVGVMVLEASGRT